jgi:transposase, IS30 family
MARQLNMEERERIAPLWFARHSRAEIARALGRHPTTIGRELARNAKPDGSYLTRRAQNKCRRRRCDRPLVRKMDCPVLNEYVRAGLAQHWSPDQIAGRSRRDHPRDRSRQICRQSIYAWIRQDASREHWETFLRRRGKRKPKHDARGRIAGQVRIDGRPAVVERRKRFGDWEGDTMIGRRHRGALLTLVERKSGYLIAAKAKDRQARRIRRKIEERMARLPAELRHTMTFDNGKEFSEHDLLANRSGLSIYFAHPYCSWERGTIENTNGLLRQFFPKGTDFRETGPTTLDYAVRLLNQRPRRRLAYRTPNELLTQAGFTAIEN